MATAASTFTWEAFEDALKAFLGLTGDDSENDNLQLWLAAAAADLDLVAGWYYTDPDTDELVDETPTDPSADALLKLGIFLWVRVIRALHGSPAEAGITSVKTGVLSESYGAGGLTGYMQARRAALPLWGSAIHNLLLAPAVPAAK
jgi:hypothetical protein